MIRLVQLAAGPRWTPVQIRLQTNTPPFYHEFDRFDSTEFECHHLSTGIWISRLQMLSVVRREHDNPAIHILREQLSNTAINKLSSLPEMADLVGTSRRSLQLGFQEMVSTGRGFRIKCVYKALLNCCYRPTCRWSTSLTAFAIPILRTSDARFADGQEFCHTYIVRCIGRDSQSHFGQLNVCRRIGFS